MAVALVGVVAVLNAVLFTENVANRGARSSVGDTADTRLVVEGDLGSLVERVNRNETYWSESEVRTALNETVGRYATLVGVAEARRRPASVAVGVESATVGKGVEQDDTTRAFTNESDGGNWTVAQNADVRSFELTVNRSSLATDRAEAFSVTTDDGSDRWTLTVFRQGEDVVVRTNGSTTGATSCSVDDAETVHVDVRNGTVGAVGSSGPTGTCPSFSFAAGVEEEYDLRYANGTKATGTYSVVLNGTDATLPAVHTDSSSSPYRTFVVYHVEATVTYDTPELHYRSRVNATLYQP